MNIVFFLQIFVWITKGKKSKFLKRSLVSRIWHCCCEINLTNLTKARAVFAVVAKAYRALILIVMGMESEIPGPGCSKRG